jgi:hypothetical protein
MVKACANIAISLWLEAVKNALNLFLLIELAVIFVLLKKIELYEIIF